MKKIIRFLVSFFCVSLPVFSSYVFAEDVNLSTYYPSPYGSYKQMLVQNQDVDTTITEYTQELLHAGINIVTNYSVNAYTPGIFWSTQNNNPLRPKAGIWMQELAGARSKLLFGTSYDPATGINDATALMSFNESGFLGVGTLTPVTKIHSSITNSATAAVTDALRLNHSSTGVPATNFGTGILLTGDSNGAANRDMARIQSVWTNAAAADRTSSLQFQTVYDAGALATQMTIDGSGNVGIGTAPSGKAGLEVDRTTPILIPRFGTDPSTASPDNSDNGMIYYNTGTDKFRIHQNGGWTDMVPAGGVGPKSITPVQIFTHSIKTPTSTFWSSGWVTEHLHVSVPAIPEGATGVILEVDGVFFFNGPNGAEINISIRKNSASPVQYLMKDNLTSGAWVKDEVLKQGVFPISTSTGVRRFQYKVDILSDTHISSATIRVVGYY